MIEILKLLLFSFFAVLYLFIISKIMGKKQIAQLEYIDYVMGISIGSIAAEMATDVSETPFYYYLIGMSVFLIFDLFVSFLGRKGPILKHFFKGRPQTIIYDGKLEYNAIKKSKLDVNDVISMCREKGYFDITQIAFGVFETSGGLSVMPKSNYKQLTIEDMGIKVEKSALPCYLIIDGHISYSTLRELNKDAKWLYKKAKLDKKKLKNVLLASYNEKNDEITVQLKKNN